MFSITLLPARTNVNSKRVTTREIHTNLLTGRNWILTLWRRNYLFFNFSTPVYKMRIMQEPNMLEL
jgi:hypothetical protein